MPVACISIVKVAEDEEAAAILIQREEFDGAMLILSKRTERVSF
jgi:hypothetical protein